MNVAPVFFVGEDELFEDLFLLVVVLVGYMDVEMGRLMDGEENVVLDRGVVEVVAGTVVA